ncbi:histidine phosphatase family protein [Chelativorans sp. YIM 93263]|uniref:histidine phosphatase family protein n=1 Tax=Chelativorans sp. YIM 93263 TaxID=2906648 RepID=UPI002378A13A|nr:histidine phosphatase family protein [Chelativorans sp. YIM 93263]
MLRAAVLIFVLLAALPVAATEAGWALLRYGGQVILINHAHSPGGNEPANFDIENCATQRNLSSEGEQQARRMGALFFARAAPVQQVLSSGYCRARDTADLAFDTDVEIFTPLNPPSPDPELQDAQLEELRERINTYSGAGNLIMITHTQTIEAVAGVRPRDAEAVILSRSDDEIGVAARINFN